MTDRSFPYLTGVRQFIRMTRRNGRDAHVEARIVSGVGCEVGAGRYLTDDGSHFAIRFRYAIAVYKRLTGYSATQDYGQLILVIPR